MVNVDLNHDEPYTIPANVVASHSPYLQRLVNAADPRGVTEVVRITPAINWHGLFGAYVNWLRSGCNQLAYSPAHQLWPMPPVVPLDHLIPLGFELTWRGTFRDLTSFYLLGVQLQDEKFQDAVLSTYCMELEAPATRGIQSVPEPNVVAEIYKATAPGNKGRALMVTAYASMASKRVIACFEHDAGFLQDLAAEMVGRRVRGPMGPLYPCDYHNHAEGYTCRFRGTQAV